MKPALVFLLDTEYLRGFKTLLLSLYQRKSLLHLPILVLTDEPAIAQDPFVLAMADKIHLFTDEERGILTKILPEKARTPKSYRTFLKLLVFNNYGYDKHIFLDTDLLCLNSADALAYDYNACDLAAAPTIGLGRLKDEREKNTPRELAGFHERLFWSPRPILEHFGFNSGVMVINKAIINAGFVQELIEYGTQTAFSHDQDLLIQFAKERGYPKLQRLPQRYNVTKPFYQIYGQEQLETDKRMVVFHHYTFRKPWQKGWNTEWAGKEKGCLFLNEMWHDVHRKTKGWIASILAEGKQAVLAQKFGA